MWHPKAMKLLHLPTYTLNLYNMYSDGKHQYSINENLEAL